MLGPMTHHTTPDSGHDVAAIANEFLRLAREEGRTLTNMQLQKLPYIAQGWSLALRNKPLIKQTVEAWPYGPVYRKLYESLAQYGSGPVKDFIHENDSSRDITVETRGPQITEDLCDDDLNLIKAVWNNYRQYNAFELSALTHQSGTPWSQTREIKSREIPNDLIKKHYKQLLNCGE